MLPLLPLGPLASKELMFLVLPFVGSPWVMVGVMLVSVVTASMVLRASRV